MTQADIIQYYPNLLPFQYSGKPRAFATVQSTIIPVVMPQTSVQTITFDPPPTSGYFTLVYPLDSGDLVSDPIYWDDSTATVQAKIRAMGLDQVDGGDAFTSVFGDEDDGGTATTASFTATVDGGTAVISGTGIFDDVTVTGDIVSGLLVVTMTGVVPPVFLFELGEVA